MTINRKCYALLLAIGLLLGAGTPNAEEKKSYTLEKIRGLGAVYIGHQEASVPFSYLDADGVAIGFSMELCRHVVETVKTKLGVPDLNVVQVPTTSENRQMMIESGTIDLQCG